MLKKTAKFKLTPYDQDTKSFKVEKSIPTIFEISSVPKPFNKNKETLVFEFYDINNSKTPLAKLQKLKLL